MLKIINLFYLDLKLKVGIYLLEKYAVMAMTDYNVGSNILPTNGSANIQVEM